MAYSKTLAEKTALSFESKGAEFEENKDVRRTLFYGR